MRGACVHACVRPCVRACVHVRACAPLPGVTRAVIGQRAIAAAVSVHDLHYFTCFAVHPRVYVLGGVCACAREARGRDGCARERKGRSRAPPRAHVPAPRFSRPRACATFWHKIKVSDRVE